MQTYLIQYLLENESEMILHDAEVKATCEIDAVNKFYNENKGKIVYSVKEK